MSLLPEVESALLHAVRRDHQTRAHGGIVGTVRVWLRGRPRGLLVIAGVLVISGTAAAAITLSGERSAPLSSIVPRGQQPDTALVAGERYAIQIVPAIQAGQISWCTSIRTYQRSGRPDDLGTGTCHDAAPTTGSPVFGVDNIDNGGGLSYVFTTSRVAAIKIAGGPTVLTRPDPGLPYGYRAAVFEYEPPSGPPGDIRIPGGASHLVTALDSSGHVIRDDSSGPPTESVRTWLYPGSSVAGSCSLSAKPGTALKAGSGAVLTSVVPAPRIAGAAFLPCIDRDLYLPTSARGAQPIPGPRTHLLAAVLLNAKHPGKPPADLPGMHAVGGHPGIYDRPDAVLPTLRVNSGLTAKRAGNTWLVVVGGAGTNQRIEALDDLVAGPVDLRGPTSPPAATPGALCEISYRPLAGMREMTQAAITTLDRVPPGLVVEQRQVQRQLAADLARLHHDDAHSPKDAALIDREQAEVSLEQLATNRLLRRMGSEPFAPTCAITTFYYRQRWPMTATLILATKSCPGPRVPVPCDKLRPAWRNTVARTLKAVPGQAGEFTIPPSTFFHPAETMKQIDKWWLVIAGGNNYQQQEQLLTRLTTTVTPSLHKTLRDAIATPLAYCARQNPTAC